MYPESFSTYLADYLTFATLMLTLFLLILKKSWSNKILLFLLLNTAYSIALFIITWIFPLGTVTNERITNLSIQLDTLTGLGFFYYLWNQKTYRRFIVSSAIAVIGIWAVTLFQHGPDKTLTVNLIAPAIWYLACSVLAMTVLYKRSFQTDNPLYVSYFILLAGLLFYNFVYLIAEACYIVFAAYGGSEDAWKINFWSYFISRLLILIGLITWYYKPRFSVRFMPLKK